MSDVAARGADAGGGGGGGGNAENELDGGIVAEDAPVIAVAAPGALADCSCSVTDGLR